MKKTWEQYEKDIPYETGVFIPEKNVEITLKHLEWQIKYCEKFYPKWNELETKEKLDILSAGYNSGMERLKRNNWDIKKLSKETRNHVEKINKVLKD